MLKLVFIPFFSPMKFLLIWRSSYFKTHAFSSPCANVYFEKIFLFLSRFYARMNDVIVSHVIDAS